MRLLFAGTPDFAAVHLRALIGAGQEVCAVITQPDQPVGRGRKMTPSPVKQFAMQHDIPVLQPNRLVRADLSAYPVDLMIVVAYGQILRPDVLAFPTRGCINVHASLLPKWRGAAPIARAILAGDRETGISLMQMDRGLDTGAVLAQVRTPIEKTDTSASLEARLAELGQDLLVSSLDEFDNLAPVAQASSGETYAEKIQTSEAQIDWLQPAEHVRNHIHGFNPHPGAFSFANDLRVKFWTAELQTGSHTAAPGTILDVTRQGLIVCCGEGSLLVTSLQLPVGKGRVLVGHEIRNAGHLTRGELLTRNE